MRSRLTLLKFYLFVIVRNCAENLSVKKITTISICGIFLTKADSLSVHFQFFHLKYRSQCNPVPPDKI